MPTLPSPARLQTILASLALAALGQAAQTAQAAKLCYDDVEQFPWVLKDGRGLAVELLEMASKKTGTTYELVALPWKRCLMEVEKGEVAGAFPASFSEERAKFAAYPMTDSNKPDIEKRLNTDGYTLYRRKGSNVSWDGNKFSNLTEPIGTQASYSIIPDLIKWGAKVDTQTRKPETLMRALADGHLQSVALLTGQGNYAAKNPAYADKVEAVDPPLVSKPYYLIINKEHYEKNRKNIDALWAAIATERNSAQYKAKAAAMN